MFVNNVIHVKQQQQPVAIHYNRDHSHCTVVVEKGAGLLRNYMGFQCAMCIL